MADEDEDGDFQEFASHVKAHPGGRYGQNFHHRHSLSGDGFFNRQRGRGRGFFNWRGGRSNDFCSSYGGHREDFGQFESNEGFRPASNVEEAISRFNNIDPQHHYNNKGFVHMRNPRFSNDRGHGRGYGQQNPQFSSNRFRGRGRWNSNDRGRGRAGNHIHGHDYYHHGVSGYEDAGNSQCFGNDMKLHPDGSGKQDNTKMFVHSRGKMVDRGGPFRGGFKRTSANFGNKALMQCLSNNKVTANAPSSVDLCANLRDECKGDCSDPKTCLRGSLPATNFKRKSANFGNKALMQCVSSNKTANATSSVHLCANLHVECKGDGIDPRTCSRGSLPATKIDSSTRLVRKIVRKIVRKQKASALTHDSKLASQSLAPLSSEPRKEGTQLQGGDAITIDIDQKYQETKSEKEGTRLQGDDVTINVGQRHQERAFISCVGGGNRKRRSAVVRDFPDGCGSLRIFVAKKIRTISKESKAAAIDAVVATTIGEVGSLSSREIINESSSNLIMSDAHVELVQGDPEDSVEDCSRTYVTKGEGLAQLVQSGHKSITDSASKAALSEGDTSAELVQASPEVGIKIKTTESGHADLVQASLEFKSENCSKPVLFGKDGLLEPAQAGPEGNFGDCAESKEIDKDHSAELFQSDLQVSNKVCDAKVETAAQISCNGHAHLAFESSHMKLPSQVPSSMRIHTSSQGIGHSIGKKKKEKPLVNQKAETPMLSSDQKVGEKPFVNQKAWTPSLDPKAEKKPFVNQKREIESPSDEKAEKKPFVNQKAEKNPFVNQKAETQPSDGPPKKKLHHSKSDKLATEPVDTTMGLHNQGNASKKLEVQDSSEITESSGALVLYQGSKSGGSMKNKDLIAESSGALVPYQGSKSGGSMKNKDSRRRLIHKGSSRVKPSQTFLGLDNLMHSDPAEGVCVEPTEASARSLVKRTLHEFESIRKALVKSQDAVRKDSVRRADLDAASLLKARGKWRNCEEKIVGEVPGVEVGDQFSFRMEMHIIGLHRQVQSGIDYITGKKRSNGSSLATSIVASGGYEDDKDDGNTLIYSGHGGNNNKGNKKQESNQVLSRGNLALTNSMKEGTPVRVIRGITDLSSPSSKIYTYDGLYDVVHSKFERGATGYGVYHFTLTRRAGQPQVGLSFLSNLKKKGLARPYLLLDDISRGQERLPVCVVNEVDEEPAPLNFTYISKRKHPVWYAPLLPQGCNCVGSCEEETCSCAVKNGNELPYNEKGYIIRDKKVVYECGTSCSCSSSCQNRVSQKGLRYRLEIFKTKNRGWGVRSIDSIQPGGFICEYTGELLTDAEAERKVENDEYLFDLGNECNPSGDQFGSTAIIPAAEDVAYTIDAKDLGNVARFINHSCSPNLYAQNVLYDSDDLRFPHVMLFAMENIPPMRELTYDYNYSLDQVRDAYGNVKTKACYCGAQDCQGRLY